MGKLSVYVLCFTMALLSSCKVQKYKEIVYTSSLEADDIPKKELNIFSPENSDSLKPVIIFIHGGSWKSGKKELYSFFGKRLARKGYVAVMIDYPLSPEFIISDMTITSAQSVKWVYKNIANYGGDPSQIYVSGHSAGGHLAALLSTKNEFFEQLEIENPIKGAILIDAAGLDMYTYLKKKNYAPGTSYLQTFTNDSEVWKQNSPIYFIDENDPPLLILMGENTLPSILSNTERFMMEYRKVVHDPAFHIQKGKKHIPMILQFFNSNKRSYEWIENFIIN